MGNLERNYCYRIMFLFSWYLSIQTSQIMPGGGDFVSFFRSGAGVLHVLKGISSEEGGNRSN